MGIRLTWHESNFRELLCVEQVLGETSLEQGPWLFRWLLCDQSPRGWTDWRRQPRHAGSDTGQADLADYRCCLRQVLPKGVNANRELMAATFREKPQADLPASCCLSRPLRGGPDPRTETRLVRQHDTTSSLASEHEFRSSPTGTMWVGSLVCTEDREGSGLVDSRLATEAHGTHFPLSLP